MHHLSQIKENEKVTRGSLEPSVSMLVTKGINIFGFPTFPCLPLLSPPSILVSKGVVERGWVAGCGIPRLCKADARVLVKALSLELGLSISPAGD